MVDDSWTLAALARRGQLGSTNKGAMARPQRPVGGYGGIAIRNASPLGEVMLAGSRADLREAFCSYCGYPPTGPWRSRAHRVCMRCHRGMVLRAPPNAQPRFDEPFLIVDERLIVQAIPRRAERSLMVNEPDGLLPVHAAGGGGGVIAGSASIRSSPSGASPRR